MGLGADQSRGGLDGAGPAGEARRSPRPSSWPPDLVLMGGPVETWTEGFVLHSNDYQGRATASRVGGRAWRWTATREGVGGPWPSHNGAPAKSLLALRYAGWGRGGQLEEEIQAERLAGPGDGRRGPLIFDPATTRENGLRAAGQAWALEFPNG